MATTSIPAFSKIGHLTHDTPFFVFSPAQAAANFSELKNQLPDARIFYAVKCNHDAQIVQALHREGASFEIASFGELEHLLGLGVEARDIIYSNPVKPWQHIQAAARNGVNRFSFDSLGELKKIAKYAPKSEVYARLVVNDYASRFPLSRKFGAAPVEIVELMRQARRLKLTPLGLTFHVGSQQVKPKAWEAAIKICGSVMSELSGQGILLKMLDIGGGFPARYDAKTPELAKICAVINKSIERFLPYPVELWTEPGRFLVANAGMAVGSITGREERSGESWLYTDIGTFGGLMEALEFPGGLNYPCYIGRRGKLMWGTQPFTVTGPTCDAFDTLYYSVPLAKNAAEGDRLYIEYAGAYTLAYASTFNGFAMPKTYYI